MACSLVDLPAIPGPELNLERVIYIARVCSRDPIPARIERAMREFRAAGLEVSLSLRGSWKCRRRRCSPKGRLWLARVERLEDHPLQGWKLSPEGIELYDPSLPPRVQWEPVHCQPRPAIVVRGHPAR